MSLVPSMSQSMSTTTTSPAPGPSRRGGSSVADDLRPVLEAADALRRSQLADLPPTGSEQHVVQAAHRASVERIHGLVVAALQRLEAGRYGTCVRCRGLLDAARLYRCPWVADCASCAGGA